MVDQLILNQNKNKNQLTFQKVWISAINFSCHNTRMPNSKAFKNDNLFMKNKLDIVLKEHNGKSKFSIEGKV